MDRFKNVQSKHRHFYKGNTPPWKEVYRKRCHERLKQNRDAYLEKFRHSSDPLPLVGEDKGVLMVDCLMADEWQSLQKDHSGLPELQTHSGDMQFDHVDDIDVTMNIFEEIRKELLQQEQRILSEYEAGEWHEEAELSATIARLRTVEVICPVCEKSLLSLNSNIIYCKCGLQIDTEQDCVSLEFLRDNLKEGTLLHSHACQQKPQFAVVQQMCVDNLVVTCQTCDFMYIVV